MSRSTIPITTLHRGATVALLATVALASSGCASFRNMDPVESWPPSASGDTKSIGVTIDGLGGELDSKFRTQAMRAYRESGLFSEIRTNLRAETDVKAQIRVSLQGQANLIWAYVSGLTLYIVPSKAWDEFTVHTTITNGGGDSLGVVEVADRVTLWQQLFLAFVYPFKKPDSVTDESFYDMNRASIVDAVAKGYF